MFYFEELRGAMVVMGLEAKEAVVCWVMVEVLERIEGIVIHNLGSVAVAVVAGVGVITLVRMVAMVV
jgi:hypothetical protein